MTRSRVNLVLAIAIVIACAAGGVLWVFVTGFGSHPACLGIPQPPARGLLNPGLGYGAKQPCGIALNWGWLTLGLAVGLVVGLLVASGVAVVGRVRSPS